MARVVLLSVRLQLGLSVDTAGLGKLADEISSINHQPLMWWVYLMHSRYVNHD